MNKLKIGVVFGGMSTEHDISIVSGTSVIERLNKDKYEIYPIYIDTNGIWYTYNKSVSDIKMLSVGDDIQEKTKIENVNEYLKNVDVVFPVLHGLYGEDGTIQGLFELLNIPYVGCKVLGSSLCMDKAYANAIFRKANIKRVNDMYVKKCGENYKYINEYFDDENLNIEELADKVIEVLGLPVFIKPSNSGSSIGINKAKNKDEIISYVKVASEFDKKIVIEQSVNVREIECAVLGNDDPIASIVGEILPAENFYTFDAKYNNSESVCQIPADIPEEQSERIRKIAIKAFKAADCKGLSRVDFFIDKESGEIYLNEINTLPGFTSISMYPQLFEKSGLSYENLLDKLISLALEK